MVGLVIVCHEDMGAELVKAAEMIVGRIDAVETVSVKQDSAPETLRERVQNAIKKVDRKKGVMLMTDMFGGTPSNLSFTFQKDGLVEIITGVNLPMLIKFVSLQRSNALKDVARKVVEQGRRNIHLASALLGSKPG